MLLGSSSSVVRNKETFFYVANTRNKPTHAHAVASSSSCEESLHEPQTYKLKTKLAGVCVIVVVAITE